jgi:hypothetical protein
LIEKFGGRFVPDLVFTSPLLRVEQTLDILLGGREGREIPRVISLPTLFDHPVVEKRPRCQASFNRLKYAPLSAYYADPDGILMKEVAEASGEDIMDIVDALDDGRFSGEPVILVTGHAVLLPSLLHFLYERGICHAQTYSKILEIDLGDAEAILWEEESHTFEIIKPRVEPISDELHRAADALANAAPVKADHSTTTVAELVHIYPDHMLEGRTPDGGAILKPGMPGHG